jgi:hypothetical protein
MLIVVESEHNALHVAVRELSRVQLAPAETDKSVSDIYSIPTQATSSKAGMLSATATAS